MKYSIWIIPSEPLKSTLKEVVVRLAEELEGPKFEPHMTLLQCETQDELVLLATLSSVHYKSERSAIVERLRWTEAESLSGSELATATVYCLKRSGVRSSI